MVEEVNLAEISYIDLEGFIASSAKKYKVFIPIPSLGKTQSYYDICSDIVDALWICEKLAAKATLTDFYHDSSSHYYYYMVVTISCEFDLIKEILIDGVVLFSNITNEDFDPERYDNIRQEIAEFECDLDNYETRFPDLLDFYFSNYINGVYPEAISENPEDYRVEIYKYPERRFGYWRSGYSSLLGGECYASCEGWVISKDVSIDAFFESQKQKYNFSNLILSTLLFLDDVSYLICSNKLVEFPGEKHLRSRMVSVFLDNNEDDELFIGLTSTLPNKYYIDTSGTLILVDDGKFYHVFYDINSLKEDEVKNLQSYALNLVTNIANSTGLGKALSLDWSKITDDDFENICYDVIYRHPKFNVQTIRKLGHSRSRDGGRDIEVYDIAMLPGELPVKWIFQCKLVSKGKSLGGSKVQDIGDMLEQYNAGGFGVMTSVLIDATLYNKMDTICNKRSVKQMNFSALELERIILKDSYFFNKYFNFY